MPEADLKIAIIGCGKIADSHAAQIRRVSGCRIVGACDREELMARQFAERFKVDCLTTDVADLLRRARPDVVHITTPPQNHAAIACQAIDAGCHVLVEKPFTATVAEAEELLRRAEAAGCLVTVGHDAQFSHAARRLRRLVDNGYVGDRPIHLESHWGYELGDHYARRVLSDPDHWVRRLPGKLLHNIISHGIARLAEYCSDGPRQLVAISQTSATLRNLGMNDIADELRVVMKEDSGLTAYFTFSTQMRPSLHRFALFGSSNGVALDEDKQMVWRLRGGRYKSFLEHFVPPWTYAGQCVAEWGRNAGLFVARDFHMDSGKKFLFESFYRAVRGEGNLPISYAEIRRTACIMEEIFHQVDAAQHGCAG